MTAADPLLDLPAIAEYAGGVSVDYVRRCSRLGDTNPKHLPLTKFAGRLVARRSTVDAWIDRNTNAA